MDPYLVLIVFFTNFCPLLGRRPPGPVQTIVFPQDKPTYSDNLGDHSSNKGGQSQVDVDYYSGKCYKYDGYLNDMLPIDYLEHPVSDLKNAYLSINTESVPDERYYLTVLKAQDAYKRGLIKVASPTSVKTHSGGIKTQLYILSPVNNQDTLISHMDISQARDYFEKKLDRECGTESGQAVHGSGHENKHHREKNCLKNEQIMDFKNQMKEINANSQPALLYYKFVLKVNRAVQCKQLTIIEGTLITGALGVKTEEYLIENERTKLRLPSVKDRREARTFFKERKQKSQVIQATEPSYSSSAENQNKNTKAGTAAAGALMIDNQAGDSSSGESEKKHNRGGSTLIASPVVAPLSVYDDSRTEVPLYPLKDTEGSLTKVTPTASSLVPSLVDYLPPVGNRGDTALSRTTGLVREEEVKVKVKIEAEVSVRRKTVSQYN